jgi:hypothetical protein
MCMYVRDRIVGNEPKPRSVPENRGECGQTLKALSIFGEKTTHPRKLAGAARMEAVSLPGPSGLAPGAEQPPAEATDRKPLLQRPVVSPMQRRVQRQQLASAIKRVAFGRRQSERETEDSIQQEGVCAKLKRCTGVKSMHSGARRAFDVMTILTKQGHHTWVLSLCCSDDGRFLFTGTFAAGEDALALPKRTYLDEDALANGDNPILMWDAATSEVVGHFFGHTSTVSVLLCSSDGRLLFSGADDGTLRIWSIDNRTSLYTLINHPAQVSCVALHPYRASSRDLKYVFTAGGSEQQDQTAGADNRIRKWQMPAGTDTQDKPKLAAKDGLLEGHTKWVRALALR